MKEKPPRSVDKAQDIDRELILFEVEHKVRIPHAEELSAFLSSFQGANWFHPQDIRRDFIEKMISKHFKALRLPLHPVRIINRNWRLAREISREVGMDAYSYSKSEEWIGKFTSAGGHAYSEAGDLVADMEDDEKYVEKRRKHYSGERNRDIYFWDYGSYYSQELNQILTPHTGPTTRGGSNSIYSVPWGPTYDGGYGGPAQELSDCVRHAGLWIVAQDAMRDKYGMSKNPFMPLVELYKKGLWPIGSDNKKFFVLIPPKKVTNWIDDVYHSEIPPLNF